MSTATSRDIRHGDSMAASFTSASFTPAANSKLYVIAWGDSGTADFTLTNTGGLSFTRLAQTSPVGAFNAIMAIFEADVGASPSSMTVTIDVASGATTGSCAYSIFDVVGSTGFSARIKSGQFAIKGESDGGGGSETHTTNSLAAAATSGNLCIVCFACNEDGGGAGSGPATPSGWNVLASDTATFEAIGVYYRTDFTGTSETCTDLGNLISSSGSVLMEFEEVALIERQPFNGSFGRSGGRPHRRYPLAPAPSWGRFAIPTLAERMRYAA